MVAGGLAVVDAAGQAYPTAQSPLQVATDMPCALPNVPAGQSAHVPALARLYRPIGQIQAVALVDPAGQKYPGTQSPLHVATAMAYELPNLPRHHTTHNAKAISVTSALAPAMREPRALRPLPCPKQLKQMPPPNNALQPIPTLV
jgi:hypothetical protein